MQTLELGFTPDPDDAFAYYALVHRKLPGMTWAVDPEPAAIEILNQRASRGEVDICAISSVHYPHLAKNYAVLRCGASVGRGYGPALVVRKDLPERIDRVAVPGDSTTGAALLRLYYPLAETVAMPFEEVGHAVLRGEVDAGVLIHEELLNCLDSDLRRLVCFGEEWQRRTSLPLPVGLNVLHRRIGGEFAREVATRVKESMLWALEHREEAEAWAMDFGCGKTKKVSDRFIRMFANSDTVHFGADCEAGLARLFHALGFETTRVDFVEPREEFTASLSSAKTRG